MATFQAVIFRGAVHVRQDSKTNVKIRITHKRKSDYISTDLYVSPNKFDKGRVTGESSIFINGRIRDELKKYTERYLILGDVTEKLDVKELKDRLLQGNRTEDIDFIKFSKDLIAEFEDQGREGTVRTFKAFLTKLEKFQPKVTFQEVNIDFLRRFTLFMKNDGVKNSRNNYLRNFRQIFNHGRDRFNDEDRGIIRISNYPFRKYEIEKPVLKTKENALTVEQLRMFINYKPVREREQLGKDMFLLIFYLIGINSKDIYNLQPSVDGRLKYKRFKTGREYSIKVEPEAQEIIDRYQGEKLLINISRRYKNYIDFRKYVNIELKKIGKSIAKELKKQNPKASYPEKISTNWARHTWATLARNDCKISKDDVALCLGHEDEDNRITDIYINYDNSIVDESNRKVLDLIFAVNDIAEKPVAEKQKRKSPSAKA